jgi:GDPmannose 4,6-dehydratase
MGATNLMSARPIRDPDRVGYVEAMWLMLQEESPGDYVVATGEAHRVRDLVAAAFEHAGLDWERHVNIDARCFRVTEVDFLQGDPSKAMRVVEWRPRVDLTGLVNMMVDHDGELARQERTLKEAGHALPLRGAAAP